MKIRKKISLLLMACVTAAGLLAGCGLNGEDSQKNTEGFCIYAEWQRPFCGK